MKYHSPLGTGGGVRQRWSLGECGVGVVEGCAGGEVGSHSTHAALFTTATCCDFGGGGLYTETATG